MPRTAKNDAAKKPASDAKAGKDKAAAKAKAPAKDKPAKEKASGKPNGRGSAEAVLKRRVARHFNDLLLGKKVASADKRDGRTEKRRARLLAELEKGKTSGGERLKPIEVLGHINELLTLDEPIGSIRKNLKFKFPSSMVGDTAVTALRDLHGAYGYRTEAYRLFGFAHDTLVAVGLVDPNAPRRGRPPRSKEDGDEGGDEAEGEEEAVG